MNKKDLLVLKKTVGFIKPYKFNFILCMILLVMTIGISTLSPFLFGKTIDYLSQKDITNVVKLIIIIGLLYISNIFIGYAQKYLLLNLASKIEIDVRKFVFENFVNLSVSAFEKSKKGEFITKLDQDIQVFTNILTQKLTIFVDIGSVILIGIMLLKINRIMTLILICLFPLSFIIFTVYGRKIRIKEQELKHDKDGYFTFLQEVIGGFKTIKLFNAGSTICRIYLDIISGLYKIGIKKMMLSTKAGSSSQFTNFICYITILSMGTVQILAGNLTIGGLVAFNSYSVGFTNSILKITHLNTEIQEALVALNRVFDLIEQVPSAENNNCNIKIDKEAFKEEIDINGLWYKYKEDGQYILKNINLKIPAKKTTAIAGYSGSGKTTLLNILSGMYTNYTGDIQIGNHCFKTISSNILSRYICFVTQESFLFSMTIKENMLLAKPEATIAEIENACIKANIYQDIICLPNGFDTKIGYSGIELSIGQKQRLSVARALLTEACIFLFDEVTSALDGESEMHIRTLMKKLSENYTVIVISHRLTTICDADNFVLIKNGEVVETGNNLGLLKCTDDIKTIFPDKNSSVM